MITQEEQSAVERESRDFFSKVGIQGDVRVSYSEEEGLRITVTSPEPQMYIGEKGQTLFEIQHILRLVLKKHLSSLVRVNLDINDYRKNKESYIREMAREMADEVALMKGEKELAPMPAAERRIVHMEVAERTDVVSDSVGEGVDRRVVIKTKE